MSASILIAATCACLKAPAIFPICTYSNGDMVYLTRNRLLFTKAQIYGSYAIMGLATSVYDTTWSEWAMKERAAKMTQGVGAVSCLDHLQACATTRIFVYSSGQTEETEKLIEV
ncbi:hypothetical protein K470DRAFT_259773 [Piedraia hortae CBS 480.64]|uniref:Uncharacterized protein n=1 Tax=Piedraia hortae CBS 480.64 TaxID=1314780 RepID=A0A6A7BTA2_9PEZI|nr:hypothetical protein K470DRAFT_259773 [Piedraia hortae CBS 480.64]